MSGAMPWASTSPGATCRPGPRRVQNPGRWPRGSTIPPRSARWSRPRGIPTPLKGVIELRVNGETRQSADIADMTWDLPHVIAELSKYFELFPGDLIFTGTPAGVSAVVKGDLLEGSIAGIGTVTVRIA
jgi:2-keto-4-pentenoate hydratase/2-oxohepta-3-ene-1,7-dioic acid hydratase in catechol pathway